MPMVLRSEVLAHVVYSPYLLFVLLHAIFLVWSEVCTNSRYQKKTNYDQHHSLVILFLLTNFSPGWQSLVFFSYSSQSAFHIWHFLSLFVVKIVCLPCRSLFICQFLRPCCFRYISHTIPRNGKQYEASHTYQHMGSVWKITGMGVLCELWLKEW